MQLGVHFPDNLQDMAELRVRIAAIHARTVSRLLEEMGCTEEQRRDLIWAIGEHSTGLPLKPPEVRRRTGACGRRT